MSLPKVLIGGFPRSGTSFLCNLVVEMGFSPGLLENLKPADKNNPTGYWEYLPIRNLTWQAAFRHPKGGRKFSKPKFFHRRILSQNHSVVSEINKIAVRDNVEVYKETMLPLVYKLFPSTCKCIVIQRDNFERMYAYRKKHWTYKTFLDSLKDYNRLVIKMSHDIPTYIVRYENFRKNFDEQAICIAEWLGIAVNVEQLRSVFKK